MSGSVNRVIIVGHLGKDPEMRYTADGSPVANFSIATSESWKDKDGAKQEKTEWHNVVAFKKLAEICGEYLRKGKLVYIEGKLQTNKWQDKEGHDRYTTQIVADQMQMLGKREEDGGGPAVVDRRSEQAKSAAGNPPPPADDDIPF